MSSQNNKIDPLKKVDFSIIRYANCWEDADLLLQGLNLNENSKVLSIASGGDNSFSLLTTNPKLVVAIDVSEPQLYLVELKKEAIRQLEHNEYMKFVGFLMDEPLNRAKVYKQLKEKLSENCQNYWDTNIDLIKNGVVHQGKFEKYFKIFATKVLPLIHSKKTIETLLKFKSETEQKDFFYKKWNTWRWRFFFKIFFSKFVMGKLGRDASFLKEVDIKVSDFILSQAKNHLSSPFAQDNFMLNYALTGDFKENFPHYVKPENYKIVKQNIDKLTLFKGYAEEAINEFGTFDGFNLSNIFEYLDQNTFTKVKDNLVEGGTENAKYCYWNLMVDRRMSNNEIKLQNSSNLSQQEDKGFFYKRFVTDKKVA